MDISKCEDIISNHCMLSKYLPTLPENVHKILQNTSVIMDNNYQKCFWPSKLIKLCAMYEKYIYIKYNKNQLY